MGFNLNDYQTVDERLREWWGKHPDGRVLTRIVESGDKTWTLLAEVYRDSADERPYATGMAHGDPQGSSGAQKTNPLEDAETSAIGRALANAGYAPKGQRPSQEEMQQAQARQDRPVDLTPLETAFSAAQEAGVPISDTYRHSLLEFAGQSDQHVDGAVTKVRELIDRAKAAEGDDPEKVPF